MKEKLLAVLLASIDLKKLANGIVDEVIQTKLEKVIKDSSNTIDDSLMPLIWPLLEKEVKEEIEEHLDLAKLLGLDKKEEAADATPEA